MPQTRHGCCLFMLTLHDDTTKEAKHKRRRLEKQWRQSELTIHWEMFKEQRNHTQQLIKYVKRSSFRTKFAEIIKDSKSMFTLLDHFLHDRPLHHHTFTRGLANTFDKYFLEKNSNSRSKIDGNTTKNINTSTASLSHLPPPQTFSNFTAVTRENIEKIVQKSNSKSCVLDLIPTSMIKQLIERLVHILTKIVNLSLRDGVVPRTMKSATVTPLIGNVALDWNIMKNYRKSWRKLCLASSAII